jgi:RecJ-like exonuclease
MNHDPNQDHQTIDCPMCHGEGYIEEYKSGGYFSSSSEQWYPLEESKECPACHGCGSVDTDQHRPLHLNTFNTQANYQILKTEREAKRHSVNDVVVSILKAA